VNLARYIENINKGYSLSGIKICWFYHPTYLSRFLYRDALKFFGYLIVLLVFLLKLIYLKMSFTFLPVDALCRYIHGGVVAAKKKY